MKKMKKGFTIVELVIVIGVIAILSAILIPTFVNLTQKANDARAAQEVSDTYTMYVSDAADGTLYDDDATKDDVLVTGEVKKQSEVLIVRDEKEYFYDGGWKEDKNDAYKKGTAVASYNGMDIFLKELKVSA